MTGRPIVVVGGGQAGLQAALSLREHGFEGRLDVVCAESEAPYDRPPLSKRFLAGTAGTDDLTLRAPAFLDDRRISLVQDTHAVAVDRADASVALSSGGSLPYDRLILATGSTPRHLPVPGSGHPAVRVLRTVDDATRLRTKLQPGSRVVVIGAGFTGLEVAATARGLGCEVTVVEALDRVIARAVSRPVSEHLLRLHRENGVRILFGRQVTALDGVSREAAVEVLLADGTGLPADVVVVGVGVRPETALAEMAGLDVADGVVVDEHLRTGDPRIHAIGDCARFPDPAGTGSLRLESVQNATDQGKYVAAFLMGADAPGYTAVPWFWTDQYAAKLQIAGLTTGHDRCETDGDPASGRFSVRCYQGGRLLGVESVNRPADHIKARRELAALRVPVAAAAAAAV
ncbi:NAD(P)/FAD-dependent oxidoreductase [Streptomyces sp. MB09-02B]|uniref:NAD(P)/FAD-dependent oxidoreductase n=1 Tax=Streptomyces sp. MB09-02B TaxID=3028667 RepID=UPI0029A20381|nr:FAD-dependent oxidoreductase [Streptomyces sp. MB09-02B]MDX3641169.1 FAD-dependent oxidoreductase [Streptomyces sp. MB09-02B]